MPENRKKFDEDEAQVKKGKIGALLDKLLKRGQGGEDPKEQTETGAVLSQLSGRIKVGAFVLIVVFLQTLVASFIIPKGMAPAKGQLAAKAPEGTGGSIQLEDDWDPTQSQFDDGPEAEIELGNFSITRYRENSSIRLRIDFKLYGVIAVSQQKEFTSALAKRLRRFEEFVYLTVRDVSYETITKPGLILLKKKLRDGTNQLLKGNYVKSIHVGEFNMSEFGGDSRH